MRRPAMPYRLRPFMTTSLERSTTSGPSPMPSRLIQPPGRTSRVADATATGDPLISSTQSIAAAGGSAHRVVDGVVGRPDDRVRAHALGEVEPVRVAVDADDARRALDPRDGDRRTADRTAAEHHHGAPVRGRRTSRRAPRCRRAPWRRRHRRQPRRRPATRSPAARARWVAKAPSTSTPRMRVFSQTWKSPRRHSSQWPQTMCDSTATRVPSAGPCTPSPHATTSPQTSWPTTRGGCTRAAAQGFQS